MTPDQSTAIIKHLDRIEKSGDRRAEEQVTQGNRLTRIETTLESMPSRCDNHGRQIGELKLAVAPLVELPKRVKAVEDTQGKRGFLAAVIASVVTALGFMAKWIFSAKGGA